MVPVDQTVILVPQTSLGFRNRALQRCSSAHSLKKSFRAKAEGAHPSGRHQAASKILAVLLIPALALERKELTETAHVTS